MVIDVPMKKTLVNLDKISIYYPNVGLTIPS